MTTTSILLYVKLFLFSLIFKLTSTAVIDLTKSDDFGHGTLQEQWSEPISEIIDKKLDYVNPITSFRQHQWVAETNNRENEHIVQKRCDHGCRSSHHRHHHHHHQRHRHGSNSYSNPLGNPYSNPLANPYPSSWFNSYSGPRLNPNPIGIPPFQRRYKRSLPIFDDNRRSENLANNAKQWQVEQRFNDRARESIKSHQPLHEINGYDRQGYVDIPTLLTDKTGNKMLVGIDETLDKSFQIATNDESNNQLWSKALK